MQQEKTYEISKIKRINEELLFVVVVAFVVVFIVGVAAAVHVENISK